METRERMKTDEWKQDILFRRRAFYLPFYHAHALLHTRETQYMKTRRMKWKHAEKKGDNINRNTINENKINRNK